MRYRRSRVPGGTYFFTLVTHRRQPLFREDALVALFRGSVKAVCRRHPIEVVAEVILPDHVHAIWTLPDGDADFSRRWRLIKSEFTRALLRFRTIPRTDGVSRERGEQAVWQRRYWEHLIRDERDLAAHIEYIHLNPVHHGLVAAPIEWPHSSFAEWVKKGLYERNWGSQEAAEVPAWGLRHE